MNLSTLAGVLSSPPRVYPPPPQPFPPPPPLHAFGTAINAETAALIAGKDPATDRHLFSVASYAGSQYVRNPTCWLTSIDLTGLTVGNSATGGPAWGGTAITPRHLWLATHAFAGVGATYRFVTAANAIVERTVAATAGVSGTDITIATLGESLPASITPLSIMPVESFAKYRKLPEQAVRVAVLNQHLVAYANWTVNCLPNFNLGWQAIDPWGGVLVGGDSGQPALAIVDGQAILWSHAFSAGGGPNAANHTAAVATIVAGVGEILTLADLSEYANAY